RGRAVALVGRGVAGHQVGERLLVDVAVRVLVDLGGQRQRGRGVVRLEGFLQLLQLLQAGAAGGGLGILAGRGGILLHDLLLLRLLGGAGGIALLAHALAFRDPEILLGPGRGGDGDHGGQGDGDRQGSGGGLLHWGGPLQVSSVGPQAGCEPGPSRKRYQKTLPRRTPWGECPPSGQPQLGRFPAARACSKTGTNWLARLRSSLIRACGSGWVESHSGGREPPWEIMFSHRFTAARGSKPARAMSCWPTTSASLSWAREPGSRKPVWARMLPPC